MHHCNSTDTAAKLHQVGKALSEILCKGQRTTWKTPESKTKPKNGACVYHQHFKAL